MAVSQAQLDIIIKAIQQGQGLTQINKELDQLEAQKNKASKAGQGLTASLNTMQGALGALGIAVTAQQLLQFADASRTAARAEEDAFNQLRTAAEGIDDYSRALELGREQTMGMASDQEIASSEAVLFGAGLAKSSEEAAKLASAGTVLSGVFASAGASQELFVRLLSSGSPVLFNNFGLTSQMVQAKQKEIEATTRLTGEEAKSLALKEVLIAQSEKYKTSLSEETIAAQQNAAAQANFTAAFGTLINELDKTTGATNTLTAAFNQMAAGAKSWGWIIQTRQDLLDQARATTEASQAYQAYMSGMGAVRDTGQQAAAAQENLTTSVTAATGTYGPASSAAAELSAKQFELADSANTAASAFGEQITQEEAAMRVTLSTTNTLDDANAAAAAFGGQMDEFTHGRMMDYTRQAEDAAAATRALGDSFEQSAQQAAALDRAQQDANQGQLNLLASKEAAPELGARITENRAAVFQIKEDERIANEQRLKENERAAKAMMKPFVDATKELGGQISTAVSGAVSQSSADIAKLLGIDAAGEERVNESVRRMAAVATGGLANEWTTQLATQLKGVDAASAFVNAVSSGNDTAVREEARKLAIQPIVQMFDANAIAAQVEAQLRAQQLKEQLDAKVNAILGEKGLQGIQTVTQQVQGAVTTAGTAATEVTGQVAGVGTSAETVGKQVSTSFGGAVKDVDLLRARVDMLNGSLTQTNTLIKGVGTGAAGLNLPPASAVPTDAQRKMGGDMPL